MTAGAEHSQGLDIGREQIGTVYGKALLAATDHAGNTESVLAEFESFISDLLETQPDFDAVLASPRISAEEKGQLLDRVFGGKMSDQLLTFFKVVCQHERLDCLREMCRAARHLDNDQKGLLEIKVSSAEPLQPAQSSEIENFLRAALQTEIAVKYEVVPSLIGGMVIRAGDTVYDGSVTNHLEQLRAETLSKSFEATIGALDRFTDT